MNICLFNYYSLLILIFNISKAPLLLWKDCPDKLFSISLSSGQTDLCTVMFSHYYNQHINLGFWIARLEKIDFNRGAAISKSTITVFLTKRGHINSNIFTYTFITTDINTVPFLFLQSCISIRLILNTSLSDQLYLIFGVSKRVVARSALNLNLVNCIFFYVL